MKKVFYFLPILAVLVFTSCEKEEADEIINHDLETNPFKIETIENDNGKIFTLAPGLYGPNETTPFTNINYTLVVPQEILNQAPEASHKYQLNISYQAYDWTTGEHFWAPALNTDVPSNGTLLRFPAQFDGAKRTKWLIGYGIYGGVGPWFQYKELVVNH